MATERRDFLIEVARLHYELGMNQETIAKRFSVSRSTISRALNEAEALGIVEVTVTEPAPLEMKLGEAIRDRFGISAQIGMRLVDDSSMVTAARAGARRIERLAVGGHQTVAVSWGRTLAIAAHLVRPRRTTGVVIVDAVGHASGKDMAPAIEVTRTLASALGAEAVHLPSPAFADSMASLQFLLASPPVEQVLRLARAADATLVSIGVVGEDSLLRSDGLVDAHVMREIIARGAEGEILGHYFDAAGREVEEPSLFPVGLSLEDLRAARRVIGVAGGAAKARSVRAAIGGGLIDELIADYELGEALLEIDASRQDQVPPFSAAGLADSR